jgi:hypothetical protein
MTILNNKLKIAFLLAVCFFSIISIQSLAQKKDVLIPKVSQQIIHGKITDQNGIPLVAQIQVWYFRFSKVIMPFNNKNEKGRTDNLIQMSYSTNQGFYSVKVPVDTVVVIFTKGPEWNIVKEIFVIKEKEFDGIEFNVTLKKLYDLSKLGIFAGDTHHHSIYSDGHQTPSVIASAMKGVGLSWGMLTDHNSDVGKMEWLSNKSKDFIPIVGCEISTEASFIALENGYGHLNQFFINSLNGKNIQNPNIWVRSVFDGHQDVQNMIEFTHKQKGLIAVNHPFQAWDWAGRFKSWSRIKNFDAIEVWNGEPPHSFSYNEWDTSHTNINSLAMHAWFSFLNVGNKISGIAGSDCHDVAGITSYPKGEHDWTISTGNPRTYAYCKDLNENNIQSAIKNGNLFLTSNFGPILLLKINGKNPGEIVNLSNDGKVNLKIRVLANHPLLKSNQALRIIYNGTIIKIIPTDSTYTINENFIINVKKDGWILAEIFGPWPMYSITNPIFIDLPPYSDFVKSDWVDPPDAVSWNIFRSKLHITIPDGPTNYKNSSNKFSNDPFLKKPLRELNNTK